MFASAEKTAAKAVVGSIVWAFRRLKKPKSGEMSARGYALHSVCPSFSFFLSITPASMSAANGQIDTIIGQKPSHGLTKTRHSLRFSTRMMATTSFSGFLHHLTPAPCWINQHYGAHTNTINVESINKQSTIRGTINVC